MILPVAVFGSPVLKEVASDIDKNYPNLQEVTSDMFETMYKADGIGLAAPQVGLSIRLFVIDASPLHEDHPELADFKKVFINAQILETLGDEIWENEGCLSLPGIREDVLRPTGIKIKYLDENFVEHTEIFEGFGARVIQHEYDHIEGKVFTDRLSMLKKRLLKGKLTSISKGIADVTYRIKTGVK